MKFNFLFLFTFVVLSLSLTSATETWGYGLTEPIPINYSNIVINETSNQSEYWNTNIGSLGGVNSTQFENQGGIFTHSLSWLANFITANAPAPDLTPYWKSDGSSTATGDWDLGTRQFRAKNLFAQDGDDYSVLSNLGMEVNFLDGEFTENRFHLIYQKASPPIIPEQIRLRSFVNAPLVINGFSAIQLNDLKSNGFLKTSNSDGTLSVDTNTYLTTETDPKVGTLTNTYIPKWSSGDGSLVDSGIVETATGVGIGTTSPAEKFHVLNGNLRFGNSGSDGFARIFVDNAPYASTPMIAFNAVSRDASGGRSEVHFGGGTVLGYAVTHMRFYTAANRTTLSGTERMRITSDGYVGIGTTAPSSILHINDVSTTTDGVYIEKTSSNGKTALDVNHKSAVASRTIAKFRSLSGTAFEVLADGRMNAPLGNIYFGSGFTGQTVGKINVDFGADGSGTALSLKGNGPAIVQTIHRTTGTASAVPLSRIQYTNDVTTNQQIAEFGILADNNIGGTPQLRYMYMNPFATGSAWEGATLKVDFENRVGIALSGTTRPTETLHVNGNALINGTLKTDSIGSMTGENITFYNSTGDGFANLNAKSFNVFSPEDKAYTGDKLSLLPTTDKILSTDGKLARVSMFENERKDNTPVEDKSKPIYQNITLETCEEVIDQEAVYEEVCEDIIYFDEFEKEITEKQCSNGLVKEATYKEVCTPYEVEELIGYEIKLQNATDVGAMAFNNRLLITEIKEFIINILNRLTGAETKITALENENAIIKQELCNMGSKASWCLGAIEK